MINATYPKQQDRYVSRKSRFSFVEIVLLAQLITQPLLDFYVAPKLFTSGLKVVCTALVLFSTMLQLKKPDNAHLRNRRSFLLYFLVATYLLSGIVNGQRLQLNLLVILVWIFYLSRYRGSLISLLQILAIASLILSCLSIFMILTRTNPQGLYFSSSGYEVPLNKYLHLDGRAFGVFNHPNSLGQLGLYSVILANQLKKYRKFAIFIGIITVLLSGSRTSEDILLAISIYFLFSLTLRNVRRKERTIFSVIFPSVLLFIFLILTLGALNRIPHLTSQTFTGRSSIWSIVLGATSPLIGNGPDYAKTLISTGLLPAYANSSHSGFIEVYAIGGSMALLLFVIILILILKNSLTSRNFPKIAALALFANSAMEVTFSLLFLTIGVMLFLILFYWSDV